MNFMLHHQDKNTTKLTGDLYLPILNRKYICTVIDTCGHTNFTNSHDFSLVCSYALYMQVQRLHDQNRQKSNQMIQIYYVQKIAMNKFWQ